MKKQKGLKILIIVLLLAPFIMNIIWSGVGPSWLYWVSTFLLPTELLIAGLFFIFFPFALRKWIGGNEPPEKPWLVMISGAALGIILISMSLLFFHFFINRWLLECSNDVINCLK